MFSNFVKNYKIIRLIRFHLSSAYLVLKRTKGQGCPIHCKTYKGFEFPCRPGANLIGWQVKSGDRRPVPIRQIYWTWELLQTNWWRETGATRREEQKWYFCKSLLIRPCDLRKLWGRQQQQPQHRSACMIVFHAANVVFHIWCCERK